MATKEIKKSKKSSKVELPSNDTEVVKVTKSKKSKEKIDKSLKDKALVQELPNTKLAKKKKTLETKIDSKNSKVLVEEVISKREVKYIYPEDCSDTLSRKSYRQKVRNKIRAYENKLFKIGDTSSKEYKKLLKELNEFKTDKVKQNAAV